PRLFQVRKGLEMPYWKRFLRHLSVNAALRSLAESVRAGRITRETGLAHCFRTDDLQRCLG
ncbi:MAG: hypothetical protein WBQ65_04115, partial [Bryobacteraceae bacterium]